MIGKAFGAIAGAKVARRSGQLGSTRGALLGLATSLIVRKLSIPAMLAIAAGGYMAKVTSDRHSRRSSTQPRKANGSQSTRRPK